MHCGRRGGGPRQEGGGGKSPIYTTSRRPRMASWTTRDVSAVAVLATRMMVLEHDYGTTAYDSRIRTTDAQEVVLWMIETSGEESDPAGGSGGDGSSSLQLQDHGWSDPAGDTGSGGGLRASQWHEQRWSYPVRARHGGGGGDSLRWSSRRPSTTPTKRSKGAVMQMKARRLQRNRRLLTVLREFSSSVRAAAITRGDSWRRLHLQTHVSERRAGGSTPTSSTGVAASMVCWMMQYDLHRCGVAAASSAPRHGQPPDSHGGV
ncbi:hypothetical protein VPH35_107198 [Triticum aestivum]